MSRRTALVAVSGLLLVSGCGDKHATQTAAAAKPASAATVRSATCALWNVLDRPERQRLVLGLRSFFGGPVDVPNTYGHVLPDARAYTFLSGYCARPFARAFLLYRLYGDAAAFTPRNYK